MLGSCLWMGRWLWWPGVLRALEELWSSHYCRVQPRSVVLSLPNFYCFSFITLRLEQKFYCSDSYLISLQMSSLKILKWTQNSLASLLLILFQLQPYLFWSKYALPAQTLVQLTWLLSNATCFDLTALTSLECLSVDWNCLLVCWGFIDSTWMEWLH